jgi:hypothetical protein
LRPSILKLHVLSALIGFGLSSVGCEGDAPPPAAYEPSSSNTRDPDENTNQDTLTNDDNNVVRESSASIDCGGAEVDEAEDKDLSDCHSKGMFYDRFSKDAPECSKFKLAPFDCTASGIKAQMNETQAESFQDALGDSLSDYEIDQCLHCPNEVSGDLADLCEIKGEVKSGVKIFFISSSDTELTGTAVRIPALPEETNISCSGANSSSNSSDDDDDNDSSDDDDDSTNN